MSKIESEFLDNFEGQTRMTYSAALNNFIGFIYGIEIKRGVSSKATKKEFDKLANEYLEDKTRNHYEDFRNFIAEMNNKNRPPATIRTYKNALNEFFIQFEIKFTDLQKKNICRKMPKGGKRPVSKEEMITKPILNKILGNLPVHGKAFSLISSSSGMRIGEILKLTLDDFDINQIPTPINVSGAISKNGEPRITFMSQEARLMVLEWLEIRDNYIAQASERNYGNSIDENDNRLFPFTKSVIYDMWNSALKKTYLFKLDTVTKRATIRIHALRKFFRTNLAFGCPVDAVEEMMGHSVYLSDAYRRPSESQLSELYATHEHLLLVGVKVDDTSAKASIEKMQTQIDKLLENNEMLKARLEIKAGLDTQEIIDANILLSENYGYKETEKMMIDMINDLQDRLNKLESD
ncbi:MAG TPA: site-specific integrase [Candidatus Glassbacteria bacterium]|nr:site-specific integrase [Candidatus Glassbacteria bacterium]